MKIKLDNGEFNTDNLSDLQKIAAEKANDLWQFCQNNNLQSFIILGAPQLVLCGHRNPKNVEQVNEWWRMINNGILFASQKHMPDNHRRRKMEDRRMKKKITWLFELRNATGKKQFDRWFIKPNKAFAGESPLDLLIRGRVDLLENVAYDMLTGQFS